MLTKRAVDALGWDEDGASVQITYDTVAGKDARGIPGFGVRVYASGRKSYVLRYESPVTGRWRVATLGSASVYTLQQARERARAWRVEIADGGDPAEDRRARIEAARAEAAAAVTVEKFGREWLEDYAKPHRRSWREDRRRLEGRIFPALGKKRLADVTPDEVRALHRDIGSEAPVEANRVTQLVRLLVNTAVAWDRLPRDHANPTEMSRRANRAPVRRNPEPTRSRYLRRDEIRPFMEALNAAEPPDVAALFRLVLLTGCRTSEWRRGSWSDVNLERGELALEATKTEPRTVYLSTAAREVLAALPRHEDSDLLYPAATDPSKPEDRGARRIRDAWAGIREASGLHDLNAHDLRRTCASWLINLGYSTDVVDVALGHRRDSIREAYHRVEPETCIAALDAYAAELGAVASVEPCPKCGETDQRAGAAFCFACGAALPR